MPLTEEYIRTTLKPWLERAVDEAIERHGDSPWAVQTLRLTWVLHVCRQLTEAKRVLTLPTKPAWCKDQAKYERNVKIWGDVTLA